MPDKMTALSAAGSNRSYFRLTSENAAGLIGVIGTSKEENRAFITLSKHFYALGLPVPHVLASSSDSLYYIQEDLGDVLLFDYLKAGNKADSSKLLEESMRQLAHIQVEGDNGLDYSICYPQPEFNRRLVMWDLNYFKYDFLKLTGIDFQENLLEDEFEKLADILTGKQLTGFMYRDFQSRNVMVQNEGVKFIDFQGGRKGPLLYDVVSFLWQAKASYPKDLKESLTQVYVDELSKLTVFNREEFLSQLKYFVLFRSLQVLGAYGFRGLIEKKVQFTESIPFALANLSDLFSSEDMNFPVLQSLVHSLSQVERFKMAETKSNLLIRVYSFSYKKGIPEDFTSNGGGFVFDCRAVHNPGKYAEYKSLTGMDVEVQDFLEKDGEILTFLEHVKGLVCPSVERYMKRGFTDLMISFGCTGGQHRSVYSAQKMAEFLHGKYGIDVDLVHRERAVSRKFRQM